MKLLNVGCGGHRPQDEFWWNLDTLKQQLTPGSPEMENLLREPRYVECDILKDRLPFPDQEFDGVLIQHVLEHFTCHDAVRVLDECRRVLINDGAIVVSVPDAEYFLSVYRDDTRDRAVELFGEPISEPEHDSFFSYALWHRDHRMLFTRASLKCTLLRAGFRLYQRHDVHNDALVHISAQLNRIRFSLILCAVK